MQSSAWVPARRPLSRSLAKAGPPTSMFLQGLRAFIVKVEGVVAIAGFIGAGPALSRMLRVSPSRTLYPSGDSGYGLYDGPRRLGHSAWLEIEAAYHAVTDDGPWAPLVACYTGGWSMGKDLKDISCVDYWKSEAGSDDWFCREGFGSPVAPETPVSSID